MMINMFLVLSVTTHFETSIKSPISSKSLALLGKGVYGTEIHFLEIKFYDIALYVETETLKSHLHGWNGKHQGALLAEDSGFFKDICNAPVEKLVKFVIFKEVKGSQFALPLQIGVRDRLANLDQYEDEEEEALDELVEYFQRKRPWLVQDTTIYFHWTTSPHKALNVTVLEPNIKHDTIEKCDFTLRNEKVVHQVLDWIIGERSFSPSLLESIATNATQHLA